MQAENPVPSFAPEKPDIVSQKKKYRVYLISAAGFITVVAIISSFLLRGSLPETGVKITADTPNPGKAQNTGYFCHTGRKYQLPVLQG